MNEDDAVRAAFAQGPDLDEQAEARIREVVFGAIGLEAPDPARGGPAKGDVGVGVDPGLTPGILGAVRMAFALGPDLDMFAEARIRAHVFAALETDLLGGSPIAPAAGTVIRGSAAPILEVAPTGRPDHADVATDASPPLVELERRAEPSARIDRRPRVGWLVAAAAAVILLFAALAVPRDGGPTGGSPFGPAGLPSETTSAAGLTLGRLADMAAGTPDRDLLDGEVVFTQLYQASPEMREALVSSQVIGIDGVSHEWVDVLDGPVDLVASQFVVATTSLPRGSVGGTPRTQAAGAGIGLTMFTRAELRSIEPTTEGVAAAFDRKHSMLVSPYVVAQAASRLLAQPITPPEVRSAVLGWLHRYGFEVTGAATLNGTAVTTVSISGDAGTAAVYLDASGDGRAVGAAWSTRPGLRDVADFDNLEVFLVSRIEPSRS